MLPLHCTVTWPPGAGVGAGKHNKEVLWPLSAGFNSYPGLGLGKAM
ncbi:MAG: hypothetical protein IVW54_05235 [Candidatus Binataceae bacterium]|nr:hypothetical protein [Candidatus Binataceae bacterium]